MAREVVCFQCVKIVCVFAHNEGQIELGISAISTASEGECLLNRIAVCCG